MLYAYYSPPNIILFAFYIILSNIPHKVYTETYDIFHIVLFADIKNVIKNITAATKTIEAPADVPHS